MSCEQLARMSDREIIHKLEIIVKRERQVTLAVVLHLGEVERRKLHLALGYGSLFDYATKRLRYSQSAAGRRIQVSRCLRRFPAALRLLRHNEVSMSTLAIASRVLTPENAEGLLREIRNKTQAEVEALVARLRPAAVIRDAVRPVAVRVGSNDNARDRNRDLWHSRSGSGEGDLGTTDPSDGRPGSPENRDPAGILEPATARTGTGSGESARVSADSRGSERSRHGSPEEPSVDPRFVLRFSASPEFMAKFDEARALLSGRHRGSVPFEAVLEAGLDLFLERHSPVRRKARRDARRERRIKPKVESERRAKERREQNPDRRSRHIPVNVRDEVYARDDGRCTYVGANGQRCGSRFYTQVDHVEPFALRGPTRVSNLRLLCAEHNFLEAERVYGHTHMQSFRENNSLPQRE